MPPRAFAKRESLLPDVLGPKGVHADNNLSEMIHHADFSFFPVSYPGFANAIDSFIRIDYHKEKKGCRSRRGMIRYL